MKNVSIIFVLFFTTVFLSSCGDTEILSKWTSASDLSLSGNEAEWQNKLFVPEKSNFAIGIQNNEKFFYICLTSSDRQISRKVNSMGLTVWLDPDGGNKQTLGIKFPRGMNPNDIQPPKEGEEFDQNKMRERFNKPPGEFEILRDGEKTGVVYSIKEVQGITLNYSRKAEKFIYELKIPIKKSDDYEYAVESDTGKTIGLTLETGKFNLEQMRERMDAGGGNHSGRGMGMGQGMGSGMGGGGMQGERPGMMGGMAEPLKFYAKLKLAGK